MRTVTINASSSYDVNIGRDLLARCAELVNEVLPVCRIALITDDTVDKLYGEKVTLALAAGGYSVEKYVIASGERSKSIGCYIDLLSFLAQRGFVRSDGILALGGGVVGDLAGFAAATYMRGIGYIQMPTTLLAAIDSSVGGKTAVNLSEGKNLVGAFYQPLKVICDIEMLASLPEDIVKDGLAEGIKYAILEGGELWSLLEKGADKDYGLFVELCVNAKKRFVERDEMDKGIRMHLNLGHTLGHAIEKLSGYKILHGFAVAKGISLIAKASLCKGMLDSGVYNKIKGLLAKYDFDLGCSYTIEQLIETVRLDKKVSNGAINLIMIRDIGEVVAERILIKNLEECLSVCCD